MPGYKNVRHPVAETSIAIDSVSGNGIIVDMNTIEDAAIFIDKEDWIWSHHLNEKGAKKFTFTFMNKINPYLNP